MKNYTLVTYGAFTLTGSPNIFTSDDSGGRSHGIRVDRIQNIKSNGSTVIDADLTEKEIRLYMDIVQDDSVSTDTAFNKLNRALEDVERYLRFMPVWDLVTPISSTTGWSAEGDAVSLAFSDTERMFDGSIEFDIDVSATGDDFAGVSNSSLTSIDLSTYDEQGNFEFFMFLADRDLITGIDVRVGNDSSNYWGATITSQVDGAAFSDEWNLLSVAWVDMAETGTVDPSAIDYVYVTINYDSTKTDVSTARFAGLYWQLDTKARNFRCTPNGIDYEPNRGITSFIAAQVGFLNATGIWVSTNLETVYTENNVTGATNSFELQLDGSYIPRPVINFSFDTVNQIDSFTIANETTGDEIVIDNEGSSWQNGDSVVIDTFESEVTRNGTPIDFTSVLPRFALGRNKLNVTIQGTSQDTQSQTTQNTNFVSNGFERIAQSFQPGVSGELTEVQVYCQKTGSNAGSIDVRIYSDSSGSPGSLLYNAGTIAVASSSYGFVSVPTSLSVTSGTTYWIRIDILTSGIPTTPSFTNVGLNSAGGYASGQFKIFTGTWVTTGYAGHDMTFKAITEPTTSSQYDISITNRNAWK